VSETLLALLLAAVLTVPVAFAGGGGFYAR